MPRAKPSLIYFTILLVILDFISSGWFGTRRMGEQEAGERGRRTQERKKESAHKIRSFALEPSLPINRERI